MPAAAAASGARAAGQQPEVPAAGMQPDPQEAADQPGILGDDPQVGGEHQVDPGPDRGTAHRGDARHLELADASEGPVDAAEGRVPALLGWILADLVQVTAFGPGAERAAGGPDDGGPDQGSRSASSQASTNWAASSLFRAFLVAGAFKVMNATPSAISRSIIGVVPRLGGG